MKNHQSIIINTVEYIFIIIIAVIFSWQIIIHSGIMGSRMVAKNQSNFPWYVHELKETKEIFKAMPEDTTVSKLMSFSSKSSDLPFYSIYCELPIERLPNLTKKFNNFNLIETKNNTATIVVNSLAEVPKEWVSTQPFVEHNVEKIAIAIGGASVFGLLFVFIVAIKKRNQNKNTFLCLICIGLLLFFIYSLFFMETDFEIITIKLNANQADILCQEIGDDSLIAYQQYYSDTYLTYFSKKDIHMYIVSGQPTLLNQTLGRYLFSCECLDNAQHQFTYVRRESISNEQILELVNREFSTKKIINSIFEGMIAILAFAFIIYGLGSIKAKKIN